MNDNVTIFLTAALVFGLGFVAGFLTNTSFIRKEAIENNAAYWYADPVSGRLEFKWKTNESIDK